MVENIIKGDIYKNVVYGSIFIVTYITPNEITIMYSDGYFQTLCNSEFKEMDLTKILPTTEYRSFAYAMTLYAHMFLENGTKL